MTIRFRRTRSLLLAAALVSLAPGWAAAQQNDLPPASEVVARYVEAIGGREAVLRPATARTVGRFEMPAAGLSGELEVFTARPDRMVTLVTIPGLGQMRTGYDGTTAWSVDPIMGARVFEGAELDGIRDQAQYLAAVRDASLFTSMETVKRTEIGGQPCIEVKLVWQSGRESFDCYHPETGLLVASVGRQESPMGVMEVTSTFSDYRDFGGVQMPTRITQEMMGQQQVMTISEVEFDTVDESVFALPAEIQAIIGT